jgi:hypothetical protein
MIRPVDDIVVKLDLEMLQNKGSKLISGQGSRGRTQNWCGDF